MMSKVLLEGFGYQLQRLSGRYMFDAKLASTKHRFDNKHIAKSLIYIEFYRLFDLLSSSFDNKSRGSWLCDCLV
jgi:hypothetical protein